jgi:hypothetical protein
MWRQRSDNEALYPYNGPSGYRRRAHRNMIKRKGSATRKPQQLRMRFKITKKWEN